MKIPHVSFGFGDLILEALQNQIFYRNVSFDEFNRFCDSSLKKVNNILLDIFLNVSQKYNVF